jgi:hypothetical protein
MRAFHYYRGSPSLMFLAHETPPPGDILDDLQRRVRELGVGHVVIHKDMMAGPWLDRVLALVTKLDDVTLIESSARIVAFKRDGDCQNATPVVTHSP